MGERGPRLAVRAVLVHDGRLLLVNAWPGMRGALWCAPGGGVDAHESLRDTLLREVFEETGLRIAVEAPCLVNEFHDPEGSFHQVEVFFRCRLAEGVTPSVEAWEDTAGIVTERRWVSAGEMTGLRIKPNTLADVAFGGAGPVYDALEPIQR